MRNRKQGRPPIRPANLMDGFYIEVRNKRSTERGVKLRSDNSKAMEDSIRHYSRSKDIVVLGEHKNDKWLSKPVDLKNAL